MPPPAQNRDRDRLLLLSRLRVPVYSIERLILLHSSRLGTRHSAEWGMAIAAWVPYVRGGGAGPSASSSSALSLSHRIASQSYTFLKYGVLCGVKYGVLCGVLRHGYPICGWGAPARRRARGRCRSSKARRRSRRSAPRPRGPPRARACPPAPASRRQLGWRVHTALRERVRAARRVQPGASSGRSAVPECVLDYLVHSSTKFRILTAVRIHCSTRAGTILCAVAQ
jgi:hypothetical protein